jgi:O-antigen/teichoic acid export membrane protein
MTWSRGERQAFNRVLHHGLAIYLILMLVAVPVLMVGAYAMPWTELLNLNASTPVTVMMVIGVLGLYILANIPIGLVANIYRAKGEFALGSLVSSASLFTYVCATALTLWLGGGLVMLAAAHLAIVAATWAAIIVHQKRRYHDLRFGLRLPSRNEIRQAMTTSPSYAVVPAATALTLHGTVLIIAGLGAGVAEVVVFITIRTLTGVARAAAAQLGQAAGAEMSRQFAPGDFASLARLYAFLGRFCGTLTGGIAGLVAVIGPPFLAIWTLGKITLDPLAFWALLAAAALAAPAQAGHMVLHHINRPHAMALSYVAGGFGVIALCVLLVPRYGAGGAALAILIAELATIGVVVPWRAARAARVPALHHVAKTYLAAATAFAGSAGCAWLATAATGTGDLPRLIAAGAIWAVLLAGPALFILLTPGQRQWVKDRLRERKAR